MPVKAKIRVNLNMPDLNLQEPLKHIADKVVIPDIVGRFGREKDISGKQYMALDPKTISIKRKRGHRTEVLQATGQLRKSIRSIFEGANAVRIYLDGMRKSYQGERVISNAQLGDILQNQGVKSRRGKRFFEFFGISKESEKEAMDFMNKWIKKRIIIGGRRTVR